MRYLLLILPLSFLTGCYPYDQYGYGGYYGGYSTPYASGYPQTYAPTYQPAYAPRYAPRTYAQSYQPSGAYYGGENCGTPDVYKPCPPLPRNPLPYYPGDRW